MARKLVIVAVMAALLLGVSAVGFAREPLYNGTNAEFYTQVYQQIENQLKSLFGGIFKLSFIQDLAQRVAEQILSQLRLPQQKPAPTPVPTPQPEPQPDPKPTVPSSQELASQEARLFELVNQARAQAGLQALQLDLRLVQTARAKSDDMVNNDYFGHISPSLGSPFDQMNRAGIPYRTAGENLAGAPTADSAHRALMNSAGHRANILNPDFTRIGIGMAVGSPYGIIFTQQFAG